MGLQNQLNDVSSDSIPLLLIALIAKCVDHLRSLLFTFFHFFGLSRFGSSHGVIDDGLLASMGSSLAGLIVLAEQLNLNRVFSYRYCCGGGDDNNKVGSDCVVCLCTLRDGEQVRKLDCRHVFHKDCFDGWLDHLNFNCPLCRSPLVSNQRVEFTRRRVGGDLLDWFSTS
ncbi:E3 ubiquitin-protein ligase RHA2A [Manihot esculenta]|uniref:RING-type domain-containing protein n=1 Tax=Manihot esculenta TaxID=3983 RepID=A0A2C9VND0_MANES|nr:E3 ubiquitin-protein ligase RHA2A [Manihot esculenta]